MHYQLKSLDDTKNLAKNIARVIVPNFIVALNGDLGSGKTTLVREILHAFGINGRIKSPTFTYVEPYTIDKLKIYHFDLYRFSDPEDWFNFGFNEYFDKDSICFIEWAEKANSLIPAFDWIINLSLTGNIHNCQIIASTDKGHKCLNNLMISAANLSK